MHAQGTNTWDDNYPKRGTEVGTILFKGVCTPDEGWMVTGYGTMLAWPAGGGTGTPKIISVDRITGVWGEGFIGGLQSGREYWVVANVEVIRSGTGQKLVITSDPKKAKAK